MIWMILLAVVMTVVLNHTRVGRYIIGFDSGVPGAPDGAVYANASTDNYAAGAAAADGMWEKIAARIASSSAPVRIGEVNQDATGESVTQRGLGFIDRIMQLSAERGWKTAVTGNEFYVDSVKGENLPRLTQRSSSKCVYRLSPRWNYAPTRRLCC